MTVLVFLTNYLKKPWSSITPLLNIKFPALFQLPQEDLDKKTKAYSRLHRLYWTREYCIYREHSIKGWCISKKVLQHPFMECPLQTIFSSFLQAVIHSGFLMLILSAEKFILTNRMIKDLGFTKFSVDKTII